MEEKRNNNTDKYTLTTKEASKCMGIGLNTMYQLTRRKDFPTLRFNRKILIPIKELEQWISKNVGKF